MNPQKSFAVIRANGNHAKNWNAILHFKGHVTLFELLNRIRRNLLNYLHFLILRYVQILSLVWFYLNLTIAELTYKTSGIALAIFAKCIGSQMNFHSIRCVMKQAICFISRASGDIKRTMSFIIHRMEWNFNLGFFLSHDLTRNKDITIYMI